MFNKNHTCRIHANTKTCQRKRYLDFPYFTICSFQELVNTITDHGTGMYVEKQNCIKKIWTYSYQQTVKLLNQNRNYSQQTHTDGEVWFFYWCWGRRCAGTLSEFDIWGEELYNKRAYSFFKKKTEFLMLKKKTEQITIRYSLAVTSSSDYACYLPLLQLTSPCKPW